MQGLDIHVGDVVQIRAAANRHIGRVGKVIGSRVVRATKCRRMPNEYFFLYTVMFSDHESAEFDASKLSIIRSVQPHTSGRKEISYETR